jgi:hypothetical protein
MKLQGGVSAQPRSPRPDRKTLALKDKPQWLED